jgi:hypothetical protein
VGGDTQTIAILDAAAGETSGARRHGTHVSVDHEGFTGHGCVTGLVGQETGVSVWFDFGGAHPMQTVEHRVSVRYRNAGPDFNGRVVFGTHLFYDGNQNQSYDQYINRGTVFAATGGEWVELEIGTVDVAPGGHRIRLSASHNLAVGSPAREAAGIQVDYFKVEPLDR